MGELVEREAELEAIEHALAALEGPPPNACTGSVLLVEGPAGIGKTALLRTARERAAARGMRVLAGSGSELEQEYPLGVARQCLEATVRRPEDAERLLSGAAELAGPVLRGVVEPVGATPAGLLHGLHWLVANIADEAPVLLAVDDAHWADEPSLRFLAYLARRVESMPALLLIGTRPAPEQATLADLRGHAQVLEPAPLDIAGVESVLAGADPELARACHAATGGNPFLLGELVRTLPEEGVEAGQVATIAPPNVSREVAAALTRLGDRAERLASAAAVLGDGAALELAAELAGLSLAEASATASQLVRTGLLDPAAELRFRHPILAGAVRSAIPPHEHGAAHARAAELLRARGAAPERVALQLLHAPPAGDPAVVTELRVAAAGALARGAAETAVGLLSRALSEPPDPGLRADVMVELAEAEMFAGRPGAAGEHLEQAYRVAGDPAARGRAVAMLSHAFSGEWSQRQRLVALVRETLPDLEPVDRALALRLRALLVLDGHEEPPELPCDTLEEAVVMGCSVFPRMRTDARAADLIGVAERVARQAEPLAEEGVASLPFTGMVLAFRWASELDAAEQLLDRGIAVARRRGSVLDYAGGMTLRGVVRRDAGRLRDAEADARTALEAGLEHGWSFARGIMPLIQTLLDAGRVEEAARELAAVAPGEEIPDAPPMLPVLLTRMAVRAARREYNAALADWEEARRRVTRERGVNAGWLDDLAVVADLHQARGEPEAFAEIVALAGNIADAWGTPAARGRALRMRARHAPGDEAVEGLRAAAELLAQSPARLDEARARVDLGAALRRLGHRVESRTPLRDGYELAVECGADGLAQTARSELRASGIRLRRAPAGGADALTPSERRVAGLAADGMANREIAQELFLTVKTVEMHLTHAYRKLDISRRAQLPAALAAPRG